MRRLRPGILRLWRQYRLDKSIARWVMRRGYTQIRMTSSSFATLMGVSGHDLHEYFSKTLGIDFRTWLTRLRIEDAKHMIDAFPDRNIATISKDVGFSDRSNFSRQFLLYTGMTPKKWQGRKKTVRPGGTHS